MYGLVVKNKIYTHLNHMKIQIIYFILIVALFSCAPNQTDMEQGQTLYPKHNMQVILDSFLIENKSPGNIYEIYIDKVRSELSNIYLYAGKKSLTETENSDKNLIPLSSTVIQGIKFDIYSGMECYFNYMTDTTIVKNAGLIPCSPQKGWLIADTAGVFTIYKNVNLYPFLTKPPKGSDIINIIR